MTLESRKSLFPLNYPIQASSRKLRFALDVLIWTASPVLALLIRYDGGPLEQPPLLVGLTVLLCVAFKLALSFQFRLHHSSWSRSAFRDLAQLGRFSAVAAVGPMALLLWLGPSLGVPRSIPLLDALISFMLMGAARATARSLLEWQLSGGPNGLERPKRALVVGAGEAGTLVVRDMRRHPEKGLVPVGFLDDDPAKAGQSISGVPVVGRTSQLLEQARALEVEEVLIAMPSAANAVVSHLKQALAEAPDIRYRVMPGVYELLDGQVTLERLRDVNLSDLLRRPPVQLDIQSITNQIEDRTVLITGAGGSIGAELVRQICRYRPGMLILFGHGENSIYRLERELDRNWPQVPYRSVIGAVQNRLRLDYLFARFCPEVVFHAAAHKHVPLMESNPEEAIFNNVLGSRNLVTLSLKFGVKHFVNISTDKAVNPTSVMGASKRMVECIVQNAAGQAEQGQVFVSVRFGNVLGSRGSVVPLFADQIRAGRPLTVTHPDMLRYFMTIPEAVQLVLQASAKGNNGEIYILDMGKPVRILDLAHDMIRLAGLEPNVDIPIHFTGMRPGEKLVEELLSDGEREGVALHDGIYVARPLRFDGAKLEDCIARLTEAALHSDDAALRKELNDFLPGCAVANESSWDLLPEGRGWTAGVPGVGLSGVRAHEA